MKPTTKNFLLLFPGLLLATGVAWAQQPASPAEPLIVERRASAITPPPPLLTAADSARERARLENARQLRKSMTERQAVPTTQTAIVPKTPLEQLDPIEREARERSRNEETMKMQHEALQNKKLARKASRGSGAPMPEQRREEKAQKKDSKKDSKKKEIHRNAK